MDCNWHKRITNYTNAQTITIYKGIGKIRTSTTRIIHVIDLNQKETTLDKLKFHTEQDLKFSSHYHTLHHEIDQT